MHVWDKNKFSNTIVELIMSKHKLISRIVLIYCFFSFLACKNPNLKENASITISADEIDQPHIFVLGIAQDGGYPQAGCKKLCCERVFNNDTAKRNVVSLAIIDPESGERWIIEATPDFREQLKMLDKHFPPKLVLSGVEGNKYGISGIFLTHGHMGHYTGLMQLGREVMGTQNIPVYGMPRMCDFLKNNGPWSQLVNLKNIDLRLMKADSTIQLNSRISVTPFLVPHRDEYTETVGYIIKGPTNSVVFIPDIDKWEKWDRDIEDYIQKCNYAFLDGTFYKEGEIPGRNMKDIPHPFVQESMQRFKSLPEKEKQKIYFIHFNHTNPLINHADTATAELIRNGFHIAKQGMLIEL